MAQTKAQLLAAAKKQLAKTQERIVAATPSIPSVNTSTIAGITAASKVTQTAPAQTAQQIADDVYATKVLASG